MGRTVQEIQDMEKFLVTNNNINKNKTEVDLGTTGNIITMLDDEDDNLNEDSFDSYPVELFQSVRYLAIIIIIIIIITIFLFPNRFERSWQCRCEFELMIEKARETQEASKKKTWTQETEALNTEVFNFISALIGSRIKTETKSKLKDLYVKCYIDFVAIVSNGCSSLWNNSNYDMFNHFGCRMPPLVIINNNIILIKSIIL